MRPEPASGWRRERCIACGCGYCETFAFYRLEEEPDGSVQCKAEF